jgi:nucleotide-binding universal stress UspA family protein
MPIKNILVHLKTNEEWSPHLDYALDTAARFNARLVGIAIFDDIAVLRKYSINDSTHGRLMEKAIKEQHRQNQKIAAELEKRWTDAARRRKVVRDFVVVEGRALELLPWAARFHDLTIVEMPDREQDEGGHRAAEETALAAGRPLVLVPASNKLVSVPETLLLAWNGSREAAAALHGSLPFLRAAKQIIVLVGKLSRHASLTKAAPQINIVTTLKQHVTKVSIEKAIDSNDDIGPFILKRAQARDAHLIIMGAYGRSRLSELVLGGATRHIFRHTTIPVLVNH